MRLFNNENSKIFSPEGSHENISPGPAVAFDEPCLGRFNSRNSLIILGNDCSYTIDVYAFSKYSTCRPLVC